MLIGDIGDLPKYIREMLKMIEYENIKRGSFAKPVALNISPNPHGVRYTIRMDDDTTCSWVRTDYEDIAPGEDAAAQRAAWAMAGISKYRYLATWEIPASETKHIKHVPRYLCAGCGRLFDELQTIGSLTLCPKCIEATSNALAGKELDDEPESNHDDSDHRE